jgi:4-hydroxybenzoate polyprenyltransferase
MAPMPYGRLGVEGPPARLRRRGLALLAACHPEPAAVVTLLSGLLALAAGAGWRTVLVTAAFGSGQLAVGWSNDYLDRDRDRAAGRADKPLAADSTRIHPAAVRNATAAALAACVLLSLATSLGFAIAHLLAVATALAYNAGLKARPVSVLPYAIAFGLVPVAIAQALPAPHWPQLWAPAAGALLGAGAHFTQALPDIPDDRRQGSRGLPQLVGQRASGVAAALLLLVANLVIALAAETAPPLRAGHAAISAALTAAIVVLATAGRPRQAFRVTLVTAALAVLAFVAGGSRL